MRDLMGAPYDGPGLAGIQAPAPRQAGVTILPEPGGMP